jgi:hypothetical protein
MCARPKLSRGKIEILLLLRILFLLLNRGTSVWRLASLAQGGTGVQGYRGTGVGVDDTE